MVRQTDSSDAAVIKSQLGVPTARRFIKSPQNDETLDAGWLPRTSSISDAALPALTTAKEPWKLLVSRHENRPPSAHDRPYPFQEDGRHRPLAAVWAYFFEPPTAVAYS